MDYVYKIVHNVFGEFMSFTAEDSLAVTYRLGEKSYPPVGYLMAWRQRPNMYFRPVIYFLLECEYEAAENPPDRILAPMYLDGLGRRLVDNFWNGVNQPFLVYAPVAEGTVFCKWIKPVRILNMPHIASDTNDLTPYTYLKFLDK